MGEEVRKVCFYGNENVETAGINCNTDTWRLLIRYILHLSVHIYLHENDIILYNYLHIFYHFYIKCANKQYHDSKGNLLRYYTTVFCHFASMVAPRMLLQQAMVNYGCMVVLTWYTSIHCHPVISYGWKSMCLQMTCHSKIVLHDNCTTPVIHVMFYVYYM